MSTYIAVSPGVATKYPVVVLDAWSSTTNSIVVGNLTVASLQDITITNSNNKFEWEQLNETGKLVVPTTSTNSVSTNLVLDETTWFGTNIAAAADGNAAVQGINGLSRNKQKCRITIQNAIGTKTITANCYVNGLAATVSPGSPVWVSPVTFDVTGDYTVA